MSTQKEDLRGLFFIVKGQYNKKEPSVMCSDNELRYIGGYDPYDSDTETWYRVLDNTVFHCSYAGSDLAKALKAIKTLILKHKDKKNYFKHISKYTSEDYYEVHYLGHSPLTPEQLQRKAEGRCPRVSSSMKLLTNEVYKEYGDFFSDEIEEMENEAYAEMKSQTPFAKTQRLLKKSGVKKTQDTTETIQKDKKTLKKVDKGEEEETPKMKSFKKPVLKRITI